MREINVFLGLPMWAMGGPEVIFIASRFCGGETAYVAGGSLLLGEGA